MKEKLERLAALLAEAKALMCEIDCEMFVNIDPKLYNGVIQAHFKHIPDGITLTADKEGAMYDNGREVRYKDYSTFIQGVRFFATERSA